MAGIYIHIPFCKQKCSYCDFHFSTSLKNKSALLSALKSEIISKRRSVRETIDTIYFGGGTPSLLEEKELSSIFETIHQHYDISNNAEITFECNPDDISSSKLDELLTNGVNRLSIGIQSFHDEDLRFFNRAHTAKEAKRSVLISQDKGFENISIDLIYGMPSLTQGKWEKNLQHFQHLDVTHLSAYTLTIEPKTALHHQVKTGKIAPLSDEKTIEQFKQLIAHTQSLNFEHYEISNFGKEGYYSQHNCNYWNGVNYLGFGPSAHSFVDQKRSWNIANNFKYIQAIDQGISYAEEEVIDENTAYNEYLLTRLRTIWGIDIDYIEQTFNSKIVSHFKQAFLRYSNSSYLQQTKNKLSLTQEGIFIADKITADLFYIE